MHKTAKKLLYVFERKHKEVIYEDITETPPDQLALFLQHHN